MSTFASYRIGLRKVAHELLWWGYSSARNKINSNCLENEITGYILDGMRAKLDDPLLDEGYNRYEPHEEWRVSHSNRVGDARKRIDIVVRYLESKPRAAFCFEAKRLKASDSTISDYTGTEGMGCFIDEQYAKEDPEAAMIAYIQSHHADRWYKELYRLFDSNGQTIFACTSPLATISIHNDLPYEWVSQHSRVNYGSLTLYHIFLDCTTQP